MAKKAKGKTKEEKVIEKENRQRKLLERLGFVQLVFDFYSARVSQSSFQNYLFHPFCESLN